MRNGKAAKPILEISQLCVRRGVATLLEDITWRIQKGEHWVILGSNGSGKTSLLKTLTGYLSPTSGEIELLGRHYGRSDWRELRRRIGLVSSMLPMHIPVLEPALETVISGRYAQLDLWAPVTRADRTAALRALTQAGVAELADRPWLQLSQGERQQVLIARALVARPELLILDEPCAGLDPIARARFLAQLGELARRRGAPALVLVTHHVEEITNAFTHVLLLRQGRVLGAGTREVQLTSPRLSATFGVPVSLRRSPAGLRLDVK